MVQKGARYDRAAALENKEIFQEIKTSVAGSTKHDIVLCWCEALSVTVMEEHRLGVLENRMPIKIFVARKEEVTGNGEKLHSRELHDWFSSQNIRPGRGG